MKIELIVTTDAHDQARTEASAPAGRIAERAEPVPVLIDAVRNVDGVPMARCMFLIIGIDEMMESLTVAQAATHLPVVLFGMVGVIHRPANGQNRFRSADDIDSVFRLIEATPGLSVEVEDFWLPSRLLEHCDPRGRVDRGEVYRIGTQLFSAAYRFRQERITLDAFISISEEQAGTIERSAAESAAFAEWNSRQIDEARVYYREHEDLALKWKDEGTASA